MLAGSALRRRPARRAILAGLLILLLAELGLHVRVYGHSLVPSPWTLVHRAPLFNNVVPQRLSVYVALFAAVAVASWLARAPASRARITVAVLAVLVFVPDAAAQVWSHQYTIPSFYTDAAYRGCLKPGETVLPLPNSIGTPLLWQAANGFHFNVAAGDISAPIPPSYTHPASEDYITADNHLGPDDARILKAYIASKHITSVLVASYEASFFTGAVDQLSKGQTMGDVVVYHLGAAPSSLCPSH